MMDDYSSSSPSANNIIAEIISVKLVEADFSARPPVVEKHSLSLLDQLLPSRYVPLALFFRPHDHHNYNTSLSSLLQHSLSKTLALYYPFVGTITDNIAVDCELTVPAKFLEARIRHPMSEILDDADVNAINVVFPAGIPWSNAHNESSNVIVQLNHFECGGIGLGVCVRHKLSDGYTLCNFVNDWAIMTREPTAQLSPSFVGPFVVPPSLDLSFQGVMDEHEVPNCVTRRPVNCVTRRFVFDAEKLHQLKAKITTEAGGVVKNPTRVEVVTALLYKCVMAASFAANSGSFRPSVFGYPVNMRPLIGPPVSPNFRGNLILKFYVSTDDDKETVSLSGLVNQIRESKLQFYDKHRGTKSRDLVAASLERAKKVQRLMENKDEWEEYQCSSLCRFPTYDIDFGWGKPTRVSTGANSINNLFYLLDNQSTGTIEALLTMDAKIMSLFQNDPELLAFASLG